MHFFFSSFQHTMAMVLKPIDIYAIIGEPINFSRILSHLNVILLHFRVKVMINLKRKNVFHAAVMEVRLVRVKMDKSAVD